MLRFYTTDASHDITIPTHHEPPRPTLRPRARQTARAPLAAGECDDETVYDGGMEPSRSVRFASTETIGVTTYTIVAALITLYEAGGAFRLDTDLLGPPGSATRTYAALWEPGTVPEFPPAANAQRYYLDLPVRLKEIL